MPYAHPYTIVEKVRAGRRTWLITVSETLAASGSEFSIFGLPIVGTIVRYGATLTAGTGTTINPILGRASGFAANTQDWIGTQTTTGAHIADITNLRYRLTSAGTLYVRSTVNSATADHTILTEIEVVEGTV